MTSGSEEEFKVYLDKKQPLVWLLVLLGGGYLFYRTEFTQVPLENIDPQSWVAMVGCLIMLLPVIWVVFRPALAIRMNRKGLYAAGVLAPSFEVGWEEIEHIRFGQISWTDSKGREAERTLRQRFYVRFKHPDKHLNKLSWLWRRSLEGFEQEGVPIVMYLLKTTLSEMGDAFERFAGEKFDEKTMPRALWKR